MVLIWAKSSWDEKQHLNEVWVILFMTLNSWLGLHSTQPHCWNSNNSYRSDMLFIGIIQLHACVIWKHHALNMISIHPKRTRWMCFSGYHLCQLSGAVPVVYLAMLSLWLACRGIKWTDTTYHSLGIRQQKWLLLVGVMISCSSDCLICPLWLSWIAEGDSIINTTLLSLLLYGKWPNGQKDTRHLVSS